MRSPRASTVCDGQNASWGEGCGAKARVRGAFGSGTFFHRRCRSAPLNDRGQATVEYALAVGALLVVFIACAALWRALDDGLFVAHAAAGASHHVGGASSGGIADVLMY